MSTTTTTIEETMEDDDDTFMEKWTSILQELKEKQEEVNRLKEQDTDHSSLGEIHKNFDSTRSKLERFIGKASLEAETMLHRHFDTRNNFKYVHEKKKDKSHAIIAKKLNKFLNEQNLAKSAHPTYPEVEKLTKQIIQTTGMQTAKPVVELAEDLTCEAVKSVRNERVRKTRKIFEDLPPDPADSDKQLMAKLMENRKLETLESETLISAFRNSVYTCRDTTADEEEKESQEEDAESEVDGESDTDYSSDFDSDVDVDIESEILNGDTTEKGSTSLPENGLLVETDRNGEILQPSAKRPRHD